MIVSDKGATAVGRIIINFSVLEYTYKLFFPIITGIDEKTAMTLTADISFNQLLTLLKNIVNNQPHDIKADINGIIGDALDLNKLRNDIVHGHWINFNMEDADKLSTLRLKKDYGKLQNELEKQFGGEFKVYEIEELNKLAERIMVHVSGIYIYMFKLKIESKK